MAMAFSDPHPGPAAARGNSSKERPMPPSFTISMQAGRMRLLSTHEPVCSTGGMPVAPKISFRPPPAPREGRPGRRGAGLAEGDGRAACLNDEDVLPQQFVDQVQVALVLDLLGAVAAHHAGNTTDPPGDDPVVQRAPAPAVGPAPKGGGGLRGEAGD